MSTSRLHATLALRFKKEEHKTNKSHHLVCAKALKVIHTYCTMVTPIMPYSIHSKNPSQHLRIRGLLTFFFLDVLLHERL